MAHEPQATSNRQVGTVARGVAASAVIIAAGQLLSRIMGLVRETVIADIFGARAGLSAFTVASAVPDMIYQLLLGGMVSAALVPVLSEYAGRGDREELEHVASILLSIGSAFFILVVLVLEVIAPLIAVIVGGGFAPDLLHLTTTLIRIILPSLVFFASWGITAAVLYARQQFVFPALASAVYNLGIIIAATFLSKRLDSAALSIGVVLGAALQMAIVLPGLKGLRLRPSFDLHHPALRRILLLYLPVIASLVVANLGIIIDRNLASRTVPQALGWMRYATQLYQLPLGLVSVAIATATLPALARLTDDPDNRQFRRTLAGALRLVLVLVVPATIGLLVVGQVGIRIILQHGVFSAYDTTQVTKTLFFYLPGLVFAAIDQPLVFAFYARKDTVTPVLVGVLGVGAYLLVGPALAFTFHVGYIGLVIANSVQLTVHCIVLWVLLERRVGTMAGQGLLNTSARTSIAAAAMGIAMIGTLALCQALLPKPSRIAWVIQFGLTGALGTVVYLLGLAVLRVEELTTLANMVRRRIGRLTGGAQELERNDA